MAVQQTDPQDGKRDDETGDRACRADVEELAAIVHDRTEPDEGPQRSDAEGRRKTRQEKRRRYVDLVAPRGDVMAELVRQQNCEERQREQQAAGQGMKERCSVPGARM